MRSDPAVQLALVVGITLSLVSLVLLFFAVWMRISLGRTLRRSLATQERWLPFFVSAIEGEEPVVRPAFSWNTDSVCVLSVWLTLKETVGSKTGERLVTSLRNTGILKDLSSLMRSLDPRDRMLAASVMGHLRDESRWDELVANLGSGASISLLSARALVQIDPDRAVSTIMPFVSRRRDWPAASVASILLEADRKRVEQSLNSLLDALRTGDDHDGTIRVVGYLAAAQVRSSVAALVDLIASHPSPEVKGAALRAVREMGVSQEQVQTIRGALKDPSPLVRAKAAMTLARFGGPDDEERLAGLLDDEDPGVRYRAAQALAHLPSVSLRRYQEIRDRYPDGPVRDVMAQVASEEVTTAATLDSLSAASQLPDVKRLRDYFTHANWRIRLQAMDLLLVGRTDQAQLGDLVSNERWWMRYEAAKSLVRLPFVTLATLERLLVAESDPQSQAVLRRAIAERSNL